MNAPASFRAYSGVERAAVLMMLVGEEEAAAILQKLDAGDFDVAAIHLRALDAERDASAVAASFVGHAESSVDALPFRPHAAAAAPVPGTGAARRRD